MLRYKIHFYIQLILNSILLILATYDFNQFKLAAIVAFIGFVQVMHSIVLGFMINEANHSRLLRNYAIGVIAFFIVAALVVNNNITYPFALFFAALLWGYFIYITFVVFNYQPTISKEELDELFENNE